MERIGNDVIIFRFSQQEEREAIQKVVNLVQEGKIKENRINRSVRRIIKMKEKYHISDEEKNEGVQLEEINSEIKRIRRICGLDD